MPQVKGGTKGRGGGKGGARKPSNSPARDAVVKQTADASSIILGAFFVIAIVVGSAAWMGQSMNVVSSTVNNLTDGFVRTVGLDVETIRVYHAAPEQESRIREAMGVREGDSMFRADPGAIKARLEKVKGLGDVQVHRFWPGQISIFVTPLEATVFYWDGEKKTAMNAMGREVPGIDLAEAHFPVVTGEGAVQASPDLIADLNQNPLVASRLSLAERVGSRRWDLVLTSGLRVQLPADPEARMVALDRLRLLQRQTGLMDRAVSTIDMRDPDHIYTRRQQMTADASATKGRG